MPLPLISNRDSFIDSLLDTSSTNSTPSSTTSQVNGATSNNNNCGTPSVNTTSSSCDNKMAHHTAATATEIAVQQTMSTSLQSSTLSDSCSDDFINEPMQSPLTPPTELLTEYSNVNQINESLLYEEPDVPIILDSDEEDQLSVSMLALYEDLLPTRESYNRRMGLVQKIEYLLNTEWPDRNIKANLFGSSVNNLGTSQSDVDLCITTSWNGLRNVRLLAKLFRRCGMQHVVCVPRAKVPIVRLFDTESQLACDMNVNNTMALENTKMIRTYVAIDPRVRPLAMIIKHWTKQRILNDAADGGTLSSYTWTCMIINFLQMRQPPILPVLHQLNNGNNNNNNNNNSGDGDDTEEMFYTDTGKLEGFGQANRESLGGLLFAFFRRYAIEFDYDDQVVSVRHGRYLNKREKGWHVGRNKTSLCVEEPFNVTRNLGNSADIRSVQGIRMELNRAMEMLAAGASWNHVCTPYEPPSFGSLTSVGVSPPVYYSSTISPLDENNTDIKNSNNNNNYNKAISSTSKHPASTLKHQPVYLPTSYPTDANHLTELHPYERRKSMTYTQRPHDFGQPPLSYRLHTINQGLHRRNGTSLPALMETLPASQQQLMAPRIQLSHGNTHNKDFNNDINGNNISHTFTTYTSPLSSLTSSHQAISPPSEQHRSVDAIFARYHRNHLRYHSSQDMPLMSHQQQHQQSQIYHPFHSAEQQQQLQHSSRSGIGGRRGLASRRRSSQSSSTTSSSKTKNNNNAVDWPTISQHLNPTSNTNNMHELQADSVQQQRRRRWSTTKKATAPSSSEPSIEIKLPPKERTLADIVKLDGNQSRLATGSSIRMDRPNGNNNRAGHKQRGQHHSNGGYGRSSSSTVTPSPSVSTTSTSSRGTGNRQTQQHHRHGSGNKSSQSRSRRRNKD
ncbi:hypothetical protein BC941DRAFT_427426 [Chlamydoabsidia padenii]|nr:hypothetical protein BC941DRAFT_427426 [Chlamydoabsidia padenii]